MRTSGALPPINGAAQAAPTSADKVPSHIRSWSGHPNVKKMLVAMCMEGILPGSHISPRCLSVFADMPEAAVIEALSEFKTSVDLDYIENVSAYLVALAAKFQRRVREQQQATRSNSRR